MPAALLAGAALLFGCSGSDTVVQPGPVPTTVQLSRSSVSLSSLGETVQITATVLDQSGAILSGAAVSWASASVSVATVSGTGVVTAVANGTAEITATAGSASGRLPVTVAQVPVGVTFQPDPMVLAAPGDTSTARATVVDARGQGISGGTVSWSSGDEAVVTVTAQGRVTAVAEGATTVTATSGAASGSLAAFVGGGFVIITGVEPAVLVEGDTATILGLGFSPTPGQNQVLVGGRAAQTVSATSTRLRVLVPGADCLPPRAEDLRVEAFGRSDTTRVQVAPVGLQRLQVGTAVRGSHCIHLDGGSGDEQYIVGVLSTSETPASLTPSALRATVGSPAVPSALRAADAIAPSGIQAVARQASSGGGGVVGARTLTTVPLDRSGEERIRAAERDWLATIDPAALAVSPRTGTPARAPGPLLAVPSLGDSLNLRVNQGCQAAQSVAVRGVVRHVGTGAVFVEDVANPHAVSFTAAQYRGLDSTLVARTLPTLNDYYGPFEDVDDNDRIVVLLTKEVNEMGDVSGFVFGGDLVSTTLCAVSNVSEIFYGMVPDTAGVHGRVVTRDQALTSYAPLIAHETTHILQFTRIFFDAAEGAKKSWEFEGGATLAEQLVGYRVLGHGSGQNLGFDEWDTGFDNGWYSDWTIDVASYFGFRGGSRVANAPEQCSWVGRESEGNSGPCFNGRAPYGVPATLFRTVLDLYGDAYPGGEPALMRAMTRSNETGFAMLGSETGTDPVDLLVYFAAALWADGRPGLGDWITSWDLYDIFQRLRPETRLQPYTSGLASPTLDLSVRAGSSAYLEWSPPPGHAPTSLRIRTPDGAALPSHMVLWVLRVR